MRSRGVLLGAVAAVVLAAVCVTAAIAIVDAQNQRAASQRAVEAARPRAQQLLGGGRPFVVFRTVDRAHTSTYGRLSIAALDGTVPGQAVLAGPACERVAFAAGRGLCLDVFGVEMVVETLDARMRVVRKFTLPGIPSRARVSPDGRWGGVTAFIVGHAYAAPGQFSTATSIVDLGTGRVVGDLEKDFTVTHGGKVADARERNYWGLTFAADGDTFYATLATGKRTYLIKGSIRARRAHTIQDNVECPSLSPDGTRIAYKKLVGRDPTSWRFHVVDLATGRETPLSETRSIDDQMAWLDDEHLLYSDKEQTWTVNADGSGSPSVWLREADSPTVQGGSESPP